MLKTCGRLRESHDCLLPHSVFMIGLLLPLMTTTFVATQLLPPGTTLGMLCTPNEFRSNMNRPSGPVIYYLPMSEKQLQPLEQTA